MAGRGTQNPATVKKTTARYKAITAELVKQQLRIKHDIGLAQDMLKNKITSDDAQARNMLKAALANKKVNDHALAVDRAENMQALANGDIEKFW